MDANEIFMRRKELGKEYWKTERRQNEIRKEFEKLMNACNHEILVTYETESPMTGVEPKQITTCLICSEHLSPRKYIPQKTAEKMEKSIRINMDEYPKLKETWGSLVYSELGKRYSETREKYSNDTDYEIGNRIKGLVEEMEYMLKHWDKEG